MKVLFYSVNGIGLGHLNRTVTIANEMRKIRPELDIFFFSKSEYNYLLEKHGFKYIRCSDVETGKDSFLMIKIINDFLPKVIVYDNFFADDVLRYSRALGIKNVLILRKRKTGFVESELEKFKNVYDLFDLFLITDVRKEFALEVPNYMKSRSVFVGPIIRDQGDNRSLKKKYGIKDHFVITVTFGGGGWHETGPFLESVFGAYEDLKESISNLKMIVLSGPYFKGLINKPEGVIMNDFEPNIIGLFKISDLVISTAGYNTINELLITKTPSILLPIDKPEVAQDDQLNRAKYVEKLGFARCLEKADKNEISKIILNFYNNGVIETPVRGESSKIRINKGNRKAANEILEILGSESDRIKLGERCNNNCCCCNDLGRKISVEKSTALIKRELSELRKKSDVVVFSGGEPTLRKDIFELLSFSKKLDFKRICIDTNGRMFSYVQYCKKIINSGANSFIFNVFATGESEYDKITKVEGSYKQMMKGADNLKMLGQWVEFKYLNIKRGGRKGPIKVFFRDDDVYKKTAKLVKLTNIFISNNVPIHCSVIPEKIEKACAEWIMQVNNNHSGIIEIGQHGWMHTNFGGQYNKHEFGPLRSYKQQKIDIMRGKKKLEHLFGREYSGIFTPPFHGFDNNTMKVLKDLNLYGISSDRKTYYPNMYPSIKEASINMNFNGIEKDKWLVGNKREILIEFRRKASIHNCVGILIHHEHLEADDFEKLDWLIKKIKNMENVELNSVREVLEDNQCVN